MINHCSHLQHYPNLNGWQSFANILTTRLESYTIGQAAVLQNIFKHFAKICSNLKWRCPFLRKNSKNVLFFPLNQNFLLGEFLKFPSRNSNWDPIQLSSGEVEVVEATRKTRYVWPKECSLFSVVWVVTMIKWTESDLTWWCYFLLWHLRPLQEGKMINRHLRLNYGH